MADTAANKSAPVADDGKPKSGDTYDGVVIRPTDALTVTDPVDVEDAQKVFFDAARKNGIHLNPDSVRLVKVIHRVGIQAEYEFDATVK